MFVGFGGELNLPPYIKAKACVPTLPLAFLALFKETGLLVQLVPS